jgi:isopenicillin N synthase-like dioxygenase
MVKSLAISMCRAHRYPPTTVQMAMGSRGIGAHTDFGALTLLLQDDGEPGSSSIEAFL